jgi:AcrR family transcriptional regulator
MPRTEEANQQIREERREQILRAAAHVFARKGLADTHIADIAAAAGVSHGLAYRYFASKDDVYAALVERAMQGAARIAQEALRQPATPWDRLRWLTNAIVPELPVDLQPEYTLLVLHALTNEAVPAEVRETALSLSEIMNDVVRRLIAEGQGTGEVIAGDPAQLAFLYLSCIQGLALGVQFLSPLYASFPTADTVLRMLKPCG